jgi:hypothetical protein
MVFALLALALIVVTQFVLGLAILIGAAKGPPTLIVGAIGGAMVWLGLYYGHKWAFVAVLVLCPLNVLVAVFSSRAPAVVVAILLNALVFVPVLMSAGYFWGDRRGSTES